MGKNTSVLLGDYFEGFINKKIATGKYSSVSEVIREALRLLASEENKSKTLVAELKIGEKSPMIQSFDANEHLKKLHSRHLKK